MSLLDKIRQESLAPTIKVPLRTDSLSQTLGVLDQDSAGSSESKQSSFETSLEEELATYPMVSEKKVGVRMEEQILEELQEICRKNDITMETLLEAFHIICNPKDSLMRQVIKEAQTRIQRRTRVGNIRSILTKSKNLKAQKQ
jgi:neutral trehalase